MPLARPKSSVGRLNILSIQSWVAYGHVGNAAAVFPLQRLGAEVWAVNTVQFSNHPGYGDWAGQVFTGEMVRALADGIAARGVLPSCDAVLSGYMGDPAVGHAILHAVQQVRAANPSALYCCDPVMGDDGILYVRPGIPELMAAHSVPAADILTPNQFELGVLTGIDCASAEGARRAVRHLQARMAQAGPRAVLVTSLNTDATDPGCLDMMAADGSGEYGLRTPKLPITPNGAGDAVAALFLYHYLRTRSAAAALEEAASAVHGVLRRTAGAGSRELLLVAAQDEIVRPTRRFTAEKY